MEVDPQADDFDGDLVAHSSSASRADASAST